jgi:AcrR family transcriptional regulator
MSPRRNVSEERKNQILEAAIRVFSRRGFHVARMDDIVQESGLSKGALYWYFKSKDEIIAAILSNLFDQELDTLRELQDAPGPARERMIEFTRRAIADMQVLLLMRPIVHEFYAIAFRQPAVRDALKNYFRRYVQMIVPFIQQGVDHGEFRPVDALEATLAIGAIIEGTLLLWVYDPETVDLEKHIVTSMQLLLDGLGIPGSLHS